MKQLTDEQRAQLHAAHGNNDFVALGLIALSVALFAVVIVLVLV